MDEDKYLKKIMDGGMLKLLNRHVIVSHDIVFFYHRLELILGQGLTPYKSERGKHRRGHE